eukprot:GHRR01030596.1.p3 GENE.GHRR01030596.1~~GHRR01030596.1.p3  ORF type:complete len:117 (+),score=36.33 GHRR01030596.1:54-404(+)
MNPSNSNSSNLFLLQRLGPAGFLVGQDQEQQSGVVKHKVMLGNLPTCTCGDDAGHEPCVHLVFVMLRVLRILANNPLVWQSALTGETCTAAWVASRACCFNTSQPTGAERTTTVVH